MKFIKILFITLLFVPQLSWAADGLSVSNWQESIILNKIGKSAETIMNGRIKLPENRAMSAFSIGFDARQNIKMQKVIVDNKLADYSFSNNVLNIKFPKEKINGDTFAIYFSYAETYQQVSKFLRQEQIYVPSFAAGAKAQVVIGFPGYLESATLNPNITKISNSFVYNNIVPKDGVRELIKLTPSEDAWDIDFKVRVFSDKPLGKVSVKLPNYFQDYRQRVENYNILPNIRPVNQEVKSDSRVFNFNVPNSEILIDSTARIYTGGINRSRIMRDPQTYSQFSQDEYVMLVELVEKIKQNLQYKNLPLYAKIGKFVHGFIRYDVSYIGRLPDVKEILRNPVGVCTEYARLYSALSRVAGIPTAILDGGACGNEDKCEGHSWNLIYYNNQWIEVDPTWDLMSGVVSSSHVYFADNNKEDVEVSYVSNQQVRTEVGFEMKNLGR